jgi:hypothetical protein
MRLGTATAWVKVDRGDPSKRFSRGFGLGREDPNLGIVRCNVCNGFHHVRCCLGKEGARFACAALLRDQGLLTRACFRSSSFYAGLSIFSGMSAALERDLLPARRSISFCDSTRIAGCGLGEVLRFEEGRKAGAEVVNYFRARRLAGNGSKASCRGESEGR